MALVVAKAIVIVIVTVIARGITVIIVELATEVVRVLLVAIVSPSEDLSYDERSLDQRWKDNLKALRTFKKREGRILPPCQQEGLGCCQGT